MRPYPTDNPDYDRAWKWCVDNNVKLILMTRNPLDMAISQEKHHENPHLNPHCHGPDCVHKHAAVRVTLPTGKCRSGCACSLSSNAPTHSRLMTTSTDTLLEAAFWKKSRRVGCFSSPPRVDHCTKSPCITCNSPPTTSMHSIYPYEHNTSSVTKPSFCCYATRSE